MRSAQTVPRANSASSGFTLSLLVAAPPYRVVDGEIDLRDDGTGIPASVVVSGTVGPDAITAGSSCGTSEIASVTISAFCPSAEQGGRP